MIRLHIDYTATEKNRNAPQRACSPHTAHSTVAEVKPADNVFYTLHESRRAAFASETLSLQRVCSAPPLGFLEISTALDGERILAG